MVNFYNGAADLLAESSNHKHAFYVAYQQTEGAKAGNKRGMDRDKYNTIISVVNRITRDKEPVKKLKKEGFNQADHWVKNYSILRVAGRDDVLLPKPKADEDGTVPSLDVSPSICHDDQLFDKLREVHGNDHPAGTTFFNRVRARFSNVSRGTCKMFTDTCPRCIEKLLRKKPTAGHQPILTRGLGSRVQIDLVDFQSMPDGNFKFLLDYYDHGTKIGVSVPMTS